MFLNVRCMVFDAYNEKANFIPKNVDHSNHQTCKIQIYHLFSSIAISLTESFKLRTKIDKYLKGTEYI